MGEVGFNWGRTKPPPGTGIDWGCPLTRGLVGCWLLNDRAGRSARDLAGGAHGSIAAGVTWRGGLTGTTLKFNNSVGVDITAASSAKLLSNTLTVESLVFYDNTSLTQGIFEKTNSSNNVNTCYNLFIDTSFAYFRVMDSALAQHDSSVSIAVNRWHHIVGTYDRTNVRLFVDTEPTTPTAFTGTVSDGTNGLAELGILGNAVYPFYDRIEYVRIWSRALSRADIEQLYAQPYAMFAPPVWRRYFVPAAAGPAVTPRLRTLVGVGA